MAFQTLLSVDRTRVSVAPGASVELAVTVQNLTTLLDQVSVRLEGIDPDWVQVVPLHLPVFGQGTATARVIIQPPRDPARALAGVYPLRVCASSQVNPGQEGETASELHIQLEGDYRIALGPGRTREAEMSYPITVQNDSNASLQVHFAAQDAQDALWYKFDPFQLVVPAGGQATAALTVMPRRAGSAQRAIAFGLSVTGEYMLQGGERVPAPAREAAGQFAPMAVPALSISLRPSQIENAVPAQYEVRVSNPGLLPVSVRLSATDPAHNLDFDFAPPQLALAPQTDQRAVLVVRPRTLPGPGERRVSRFRATATPLESAVPAVSAEATLVQTEAAAPPVQRSPWPIIAALALALLVLAVMIAITLAQR
ncbi:MAG: hypothetical protein JXA74_02035 [Anaerolineae bacterium]|nr:hypothetical protein [Anaerolineae bacterium]